MPTRNGKIRVFRARDHHLIETVEGGKKIRRVASTPTSEVVVGGRSDGILEVYQHDGSRYQQIQQLNPGFLVLVLLMHQEIIIASGDSKICIYRYDGIEYRLSQIISTSETII